MFVQHGTTQKQLNLINSVKPVWSNGAENQSTAELISQPASMLHAALVTKPSKASSWSEPESAVVDFARVRFT